MQDLMQDLYSQQQRQQQRQQQQQHQQQQQQESRKLLTTIGPRAHRYPFRLAVKEALKPQLAGIVEREGWESESGVVGPATRAGEGSVRDSLTAPDQSTSAAEDNMVECGGTALLLGLAPKFQCVTHSRQRRKAAEIFHFPL